MSDHTSSAEIPHHGSAAGILIRLAGPALGVLTAVCYALAMARDFEFDIGHFTRTSLFFRIAEIASILGVALAAVLAVRFYARAAYTSLPAPSGLSVFGGFVGAVLSVALCLRSVLHYADDLAAETAESLSSVKIALAAAVFGLFLAAGLILALSKDRRHRWYALICTLLGAFSVNISMFAAYFDFSVPLNSPVRNFTTLCQASVLLFLLSEARIALCDEAKPEELPPAFQLFTSVCCSVFGIGIGGGGALWLACRSFLFGSDVIAKTPEPNLNILRLAVYFAVGVIAADRLLHTDLRLLSKEEIAENREKAREKAREEKEKKKRAPASGNETTDHDQ